MLGDIPQLCQMQQVCFDEIFASSFPTRRLLSIIVTDNALYM